MRSTEPVTPSRQHPVASVRFGHKRPDPPVHIGRVGGQIEIIKVVGRIRHRLGAEVGRDLFEEDV